MDIHGHVLAAVDDAVTATLEALHAIARDTPPPPARRRRRPVRPHTVTASSHEPAEPPRRPRTRA
jgi:hypothetical protein